MFPKSFHQILFYKKKRKKQPFHTSARRPPRPLLAGVYSWPESGCVPGTLLRKVLQIVICDHDA